jgi:fumarylacetoacetase
LPNWLHIPVGYRQKFIHCSFWNSGSQTNGTNTTKWRNYTVLDLRSVDFELETAFITDVNIMGENIAVTEAEDYILEWFY